MKLIKELTEMDLGLTVMQKAPSEYKLRKASRAVLRNSHGEIAVLYVKNGNYYKLPGGGMEEGENIAEALIREIKEETGAVVELAGEVGCIIEYRDEHRLLQLSYCYLAVRKELTVKPSFTEQEIHDGFELRWVKVDEAVNLLRETEPENYVGKFISRRDLLFLEEAYKSSSFWS